MTAADAFASSDWFDGSEHPSRAGVYSRRFPGGPYSCWGGGAWFGDAQTPDLAARASEASPHQDVPWRGRLQAPAFPCASCRGHGIIDLGEDDAAGWPLLRPCAEC